MAFEGIDRKRFEYLLHFGTSDDELRRFFSECRLQLIQKGGRVQNLPYGHQERIRTLSQSLPPATDPVVRNWFSKHLEMSDLEPLENVLKTFQDYEELGEILPEDQAEKLSRSCLVFLFSEVPSVNLLNFLRNPVGGVPSEAPANGEERLEPIVPEQVPAPTLVSSGFASSLVALVEGRDPDEFLATLPADVARLVSAIYAVKNGREDSNTAIGSLSDYPETRKVLEEFVQSRAMAAALPGDQPLGIVPAIVSTSFRIDNFDIERDEVVGVCTSASSPTTVFVKPFAIRTSEGEIALLTEDEREALFPTSGALIAFPGSHSPKQPQRGDVGIWRVSPNPNSNATHRTRYHLSSERTPVYEVKDVPCRSNDPDGVREFVKDQFGVIGTGGNRNLLFLLRDGKIVGCPIGKDLSRDEGFEGGLPSWGSLEALQFEGRRLVPGPLPPARLKYECETLASSLRKLFASMQPGPDKPTRAQQRKLQDLLSSGDAALNVDRAARLRAELGFIEEQDAAMQVLFDEVMRDERIAARIDAAIKKEVDERVESNERLRADTARLEKLHTEALEKHKKLEKEQKALGPAVAKAIRSAFEKASSDALGTLGQSVVFKALIDELEGQRRFPEAQAVQKERNTPNIIRTVRKSSAGSFVEVLQTLGLSSRHAKAVILAGDLAVRTGLIVALDGKVCRLAAEAWGNHLSESCQLLECSVGWSDDCAVTEVMALNPPALVILDANISPFEVYARRIIDDVQRGLIGGSDQHRFPPTLLSLSNGITGLPVPETLKSIAVFLSLDSAPVFMEQEEVSSLLEEAKASSEMPNWLSSIWKPARKRLLEGFNALEPHDAALALSLIAAKDARYQGTEFH